MFDLFTDTDILAHRVRRKYDHVRYLSYHFGYGYHGDGRRDSLLIKTANL